MSDDDDLASLLADISTSVDADLVAISSSDAEAEGADAPPEDDWVPPYIVDVEMPIDVSIALDDLVASLQQFLDTASGFLQGDHLDVAGTAQELSPVGSPDEYPAAVAQLAAWQATVDGRTRGLAELIGLLETDRQVVLDYSGRMSEVFAGAPPPPVAPPPPPPPEEEGPDEPAMTPV